MRTLAVLRCWWEAIFHRSHVSDEVEQEFQFHVDAYVEDLVKQGMSPAEAERKALIELGCPDVQKEKYRQAIGLRPFDEIGADIRYGLRSLFKNPGFSGVAILSLALGIGATTAMFSLIYAVLIHPFPYADSGRITNPVVINEERPQQPTWFAMTKSQYETLRKAKCIQTLLGFRNVNMELTGDELPQDVAGIYLTENANTFFGVRALLGRDIQPSDAHAGGQPVVVLNYKFWQRQFGGNPAVVGHVLQLDHTNYTIVGVMPHSFAFNDTLGIGDVYLPRSLLHDNVNPPIQWPYIPWIKLKHGVNLTEADSEIGAIVKQFAKEYPRRFPKKFHLQLQPIAVPYQQNVGRTLMLLLAGVLLLLVVGCVNCSILLLARGEARQHELSVRSAIGASRWRIVRQLLVESLILSLSGALLGVAAAYWLAKLPLKLSPGSFPAELVVRTNIPILAFSVGMALLSGILFGLGPALRSSRPALAHAMQSTMQRIAGRSAPRRFNALVAGQIALTLVLLATGGTAINGFIRLSRVPLGYDPHDVMQAGIVMHWNDPNNWNSIKSREQRAAFIDRIRQKIASLPGILSVAIGTDSTPPYSGVQHTFDISSAPDVQERQARIHLVSPEYFPVLEIPLLRGRIWDQTENERGDNLAVINESLAKRYWPHEGPIGQQLRIPTLTAETPLEDSSADSAGWRQVIGVVADARNDGVDRPDME